MPESSVRFVLSTLAAVTALASAVLAEQGARVQLRSGEWTVSLDPSTLQAEASLPVGTRVQLSGSQDIPGEVRDLERDNGSAGWRYARLGLSVSCRLSGSDFSVRFVSDRPGQFTWPLVEPTPQVRAYILPYHAGRYVPTADAQWVAFLSGKTFSTVEQLSMPFWGLDCETRTLTYVLTNPLHNDLAFSDKGGEISFRLTHSFTRIQKRKEYGFVIRLGNGSPVEPARQYRRWLEQRGEFVSIEDKIRRVPRVERLLGAPHAYLWGASLSKHDILNWQGFCARLKTQGEADVPSPGKRIWDRLDSETRKNVAQAAELKRPWGYLRAQVARQVGLLLERRDFYEDGTWGNLRDKTLQARVGTIHTLSDVEIHRLNCRLLHAAFPGLFSDVDSWGGGVSTRMLELLSESGLERLCLTLSDSTSANHRPNVARKAEELGYVLGPYDSYHSIHHPEEKDTWRTAQFDLALYNTGAIVREDGTKRRGFKKKGYKLSPIAARPYVEKRVHGLMRMVPFTSWFVDCDAYGEVFDDYSELHPATQEDDMRARLDRMAWISESFRIAIGSEGGSAYAAGVIHFAHGVMTPVFGWGDPELKDRKSKYWLGGYWPPEGPAVFVKPVPLKPAYAYFHFDPRFRLPLYQVVFNDSVIATHHWGRGSLKFTDQIETTALIELLYNVPPLYHLNLDEFEKHGERIKRHYEFFSPLHRELALLPLTDFAWLSADRFVQRTVFGKRVELVANFSRSERSVGDLSVPPRTVIARWLDSGATRSFAP